MFKGDQVDHHLKIKTYKKMIPFWKNPLKKTPGSDCLVILGGFKMPISKYPPVLGQTLKQNLPDGHRAPHESGALESVSAARGEAAALHVWKRFKQQQRIYIYIYINIMFSLKQIGLYMFIIYI